MPENDRWVLKKARKYQKSLGFGSEVRKIGPKESWMRIKWAICKKDDVARFKADLMGHTQGMLMLMAAIQR
jgi:hypothetical protein